MFFFEPSFLCVALNFPLCFLSYLIFNCSTLIYFLSETLRVKAIKKVVYLVTGNSLNNFMT